MSQKVSLLWILSFFLFSLQVSQAEESRFIFKETLFNNLPREIEGVEERVLPPDFRGQIIDLSTSRAPLEEKQRDFLHHLVTAQSYIEEVISRYDQSGISLVIEKWWFYHAHSQKIGQAILSGVNPGGLIFDVYLQYWQLKLLLTNPHYFKLNLRPHITLAYAMHYYLFFQALLRHAHLLGFWQIREAFSPQALKKIEEGQLDYFFGNLKLRATRARELVTSQQALGPTEDSFRILAVYQNFEEHSRGSTDNPQFNFVHLGATVHIDRSNVHAPHPFPLAARVWRSALYTEYIAGGSQEASLRWVIDPLLSDLPLPLPLWRVLAAKSLLATYGLPQGLSTEGVITPSNLPPVVHDILDTRVQIGGKTRQIKEKDTHTGFSKESMEEWKDGIPLEETFEQRGGTAMAPEELDKKSQEFIPIYADDPLIDAQELDRILRLEQNMTLEEFVKLERVYREFYKLKGDIFSVHMAGNIMRDKLGAADSRLRDNLNLITVPTSDLLWMAQWLAFLTDEMDLIIKILESKVAASSSTDRYELLEATLREARHYIKQVETFFAERGCKTPPYDSYKDYCKMALILFLHPEIDLSQEFNRFRELNIEKIRRYEQGKLTANDIEKLTVFFFAGAFKRKYGESRGTTVGCLAVPPEMMDDMRDRGKRLLARGVRLARKQLHLDRDTRNAERRGEVGENRRPQENFFKRFKGHR